MGAVIDGARPDLAESLREALVTGRYAHGQKLKTADLARDFAASATSLREALFRLYSEGLVDFHQQRGFRVPDASPEQLHDLTQLRIYLEQQGARLSVQMGDVDWEARLTAAHHKLNHIETRVERFESTDTVFQLWVQGEKEFHQTLIGNCGCQSLIDAHLTTYMRFRQQTILQDRNFFHVPASRNQHLEILDAALTRDTDRVCQAIHDHLQRHLLRPLPVLA